MEKKSSEIIRNNLSGLLKRESNTSMKGLSLGIGASDSYIEKILGGKSNLSIDRLDVISKYFDAEGWMLLFDERPDIIPVLQKLNKLSAENLAAAREFLIHLSKIQRRMR